MHRWPWPRKPLHSWGTSRCAYSGPRYLREVLRRWAGVLDLDNGQLFQPTWGRTESTPPKTTDPAVRPADAVEVRGGATEARWSWGCFQEDEKEGGSFRTFTNELHHLSVKELSGFGRLCETNWIGRRRDDVSGHRRVPGAPQYTGVGLISLYNVYIPRTHLTSVLIGSLAIFWVVGGPK